MNLQHVCANQLRVLAFSLRVPKHNVLVNVWILILWLLNLLLLWYSEWLPHRYFQLNFISGQIFVFLLIIVWISNFWQGTGPFRLTHFGLFVLIAVKNFDQVIETFLKPSFCFFNQIFEAWVQVAPLAPLLLRCWLLLTRRLLLFP